MKKPESSAAGNQSPPIWIAMLEAGEKECQEMIGIPPDADQRIMASYLEVLINIEFCGCKLPRFWRDAFHHEAVRARRGEQPG